MKAEQPTPKARSLYLTIEAGTNTSRAKVSSESTKEIERVTCKFGEGRQRSFEGGEVRKLLVYGVSCTAYRGGYRGASVSVLQAQVPVLGSRAKSRQARDGRLRESLLISSIWRRMESYYFVQ